MGNGLSIFLTPDVLVFVGNKDWDNLRSTNNEAKHLIIGPNIFKNSVSQLINHRDKSFFASLEDIYDEFSGGNKDPIAIRYFLNWTQTSWSA